MKKKTVRKVLKKMRKVCASNVKRGHRYNTESENLVANWPSQWSDEDIDHVAKEVCK